MENNIQNMVDEAVEQSKADQLMANVDIGFIRECIYEQIDNIFGTSEKTNHLKILKKQITESEGIEKEYIDTVCDELYQDIIRKIGERLNFQIDDTEVNREVMASNLYKFFVLHYVRNVVMFLESTIINQKHEIVSELKNVASDKSRIGEIPNEMALIIKNIPDVINIISGLELDFDDYVNRICDHDDCKASAEEVKRYYDEGYLSDTEDILPIILKNLIDENEGFGDIDIELQSILIDKFRA